MIDLNKKIIAEKFASEYASLNDAKKEEFSRCVAKLLTENFIYGQKGHDCKLYDSIGSMRNTIELYLALSGFELYCDDNYKIYFLTSKHVGIKARLKKLDTVVLLVLAKMYATKYLEVSVNAGPEVSVNIQEVVDFINRETKIYKKDLNKGDLSSALKTLKKYKIIDVGSTDINNVSTFNILPTIIYIVRDQDLIGIENKLDSLKNLNAYDESEEDESEADNNEIEEN